MPVIYTFCHQLHGNVAGYAMAEDGTLLSGHISSSEAFSRGDLARDYHRERYAAHYPAGYELTFVTMAEFDAHAGLAKARALNEAAKTDTSS